MLFRDDPPRTRGGEAVQNSRVLAGSNRPPRKLIEPSGVPFFHIMPAKRQAACGTPFVIPGRPS